jgi:hypothetical protein
MILKGEWIDNNQFRIMKNVMRILYLRIRIEY